MVYHVMVHSLMKRLQEDGFTITQVAGVDGYRMPTLVGGHTPDLVGTDPCGLKAFGLCSTKGDLSAKQTKEKIYLFAHQRMLKSTKMVPFYVAVPAGYENQLEEVLGEVGIANYPNLIRVYIDCSHGGFESS